MRQAETGVVTPPETLLYRLAIRAACGGKEDQIKATTTTDELVAYLTGADYPVWPEKDVPQEPERARNADGTFVGDDPATSGVNEAWTDGGQG